MTNLKRAVCSFLTAAALLTSLPAAVNAGFDNDSANEKHDYIIETSCDADTASVLGRISAADKNADTLYEYSSAVFYGAAVSTSLEIDELSSIDGVLEVSIPVERTPTRPYVSSAASMVGITELRDAVSADTALRGQGMVAAVLDAGFEVDHPVFTISDETEPALTKEDIDAAVEKGLRVSSQLKMREVSPYISRKVPFAYDYGSSDPDVSTNEYHGTAVASVLAGRRDENDDESFDGIAPEAQLLLMKVTSDNTGAISDLAVLAALSDAIALGADVINLSFGVDAGFVNIASGFDYGTVINRAANLGIEVFCAVGNSGRVGGGSAWDTAYEIKSPEAANPDYGLAAEPSVIDNAIAVGSYENDYITISEYIRCGEDMIIYHDAQYSDIIKKYGGKSLDIAVIPNLGEPKDFEGIDVTGKAAVIERGTIMFEEKIKNAANAGAAAVIVYNNVDDLDLLLMAASEELPIPAVFVSRADGLKIIENGTSVTFVESELAPVPSPLAGSMSEFSSWGSTTMLGIKPDITAPGGYIRAASTDGGYLVVSGTSFASPIAAGCAVLYEQVYGETVAASRESEIILAEKDKTYSLSHTRRMLMSGAVPLTDENGVEFSVRSQGSGLINAARAIGADCCVIGASGQSKLELGDRLGSTFDIPFTVVSYSDEDVTYAVDVSLITDGHTYNEDAGVYFVGDTQYAVKKADIRLVDENGNALSGSLNRHKNGHEKAEITVPAGEKLGLTLRVTIDEAEYAALGEIFENGFFAEGYVYFECAGGGADLSVPFLGFTSDWGALPIFDDDYGKRDLLTYVTVNGRYMIFNLNLNTFAEEDTLLEDTGLAASETEITIGGISPDGDKRGDRLGVLFAHLRSIEELRVEIIDPSGEIIIDSGDVGSMKKSIYDNNTEELAKNGISYIWDGRDPDNPSYIMPEGKYTLRLCASPEWEEAEEQYVDFDFYIDRTSPELESVKVYTKGGRTYLEAAVSDDLGMQTAMLYAGEKADEADADGEGENESETKTEADADDDGLSYKDMRMFGDKVTHAVLTFDITDCAKDNKYLYLDIIDYSYNWTVERIEWQKLK